MLWTHQRLEKKIACQGCYVTEVHLPKHTSENSPGYFMEVTIVDALEKVVKHDDHNKNPFRGNNRAAAAFAHEAQRLPRSH